MHENIVVTFRRCLADAEDEAWNDFVSRHGREVRRVVVAASRRVGLEVRREDVDELTQDLYLRLLQGAPRRFEGTRRGQVWSYVHRVARNLAADRRRNAFRDKRAGRPAASPPTVEAQIWLETLPGRRRTPEDDALSRERRRTIAARCRRAIGSGRGAERDLRLFALALAGTPTREIAAREGLTPRGVDSAVYRLRRRLRRAGVHLPRRNASSRRGVRLDPPGRRSRRRG